MSITARIDALLANTPASEVEEIEVCRCLRDAKAEVERLRQQRDHWMAAAMAFDEHLATMRVMMMEHPSVRFPEVRY